MDAPPISFLALDLIRTNLFFPERRTRQSGRDRSVVIFECASFPHGAALGGFCLCGRRCSIGPKLICAARNAKADFLLIRRGTQAFPSDLVWVRLPFFSGSRTSTDLPIFFFERRATLIGTDGRGVIFDRASAPYGAASRGICRRVGALPPTVQTAEARLHLISIPNARCILPERVFPEPCCRR